MQEGQFAKNLRWLMDERNLNQVKLAIAVGTTQASISRYLRGRKPETSELLKLAHCFGVSAEALLNGTLGKSHLDGRARQNSIGSSTPAKAEEQKAKRSALEIILWEARAALTEKIIEDYEPVVLRARYRTRSRKKGNRPNTIVLRGVQHASDAGRLICGLMNGEPPEIILAACLPEDLRSKEFIESLDPFFRFALTYIAFLLTFGSTGGVDEYKHRMRQHYGALDSWFETTVPSFDKLETRIAAPIGFVRAVLLEELSKAKFEIVLDGSWVLVFEKAAGLGKDFTGADALSKKRVRFTLMEGEPVRVTMGVSITGSLLELESETTLNPDTSHRDFLNHLKALAEKGRSQMTYGNQSHPA